jgi:glycosyltransferase involved in cell wall biosynthesis
MHPPTTSSDEPAASVIVPARDVGATLSATLDALKAQRLDAPYEVVVVDDGSTDATARIAREFGPPVSVVHQEGQGPGPARNAGVAAARGRALAFTDADCLPRSDWLREGLAALAGADLVQGAVRPDPSVDPQPFDRTIWVTELAGLFETANLFVTRDLFSRLGGFEHPVRASLGKPLGEDLWFGWRATRAGARIRFSDRAVVEHAVFRRRPRAFVVDRARVAYFPPMAAMVPELRESLFFARWFLNRRTAAFDVAVIAAGAAPIAGSPLPLVLVAPYLWQLLSSVRRWGRRAPKVGAVEVVADAVGLAALLYGSTRARTLVI